MKRSSQKPTDIISNNEHTSPRDQSWNPKSASWEKNESSSNRFAGMSKDLERVPSLHFPGYKSRG